MLRNFFIILVSLVCLGFRLPAQQAENSKVEEGFRFQDVVSLPVTSVKDQNKSSTCWSYATVSFIESEMLRMGKPVVDLSEMFIVWKCYEAKADRYVRMQGNTNFGPGGAFHDVMWVFEKYGMVPQSAYHGQATGDSLPVHGELDEVLKNYVDGVIKNKNKKLTPVWSDGFNALLNNYLGEVPSKFLFEEKEYSPKSFAAERIGINPSEYVEIGSFSHHPYYSKFILEVPDNWLWESIHNVPLNDMMTIVDYALDNGFTIAWGADTSDKGFATKAKGIAIIPEIQFNDMSTREIAKWEKLSSDEKDKELYKMSQPGLEKKITQEMRQIDFDNYSTTDDHGMHIIGKATDQNGTVYYKVKNSWGNYNAYNGYFYASKAYVALRTIDFMVHKDGIPKELRKKMKIE